MEDFVTSKGKPIQPDSKHLLIDGDILCYATASAADGRAYRVKDGTLNNPVFDTAKEANDYLETLNLSKMWRETVYIPEPVENCLHSLKLMTDAVLEGAGSNKHTIFITGKDNFRYNVDPYYKANRANTHKPHHLKACQEYLLKNYNTRVVHGAEADDMMGIVQCQSEPGTTMICSLDKDLDMIPGWHYKWATGNTEASMYEVSFIESFRNFFKQLITGDTTDNIEGLSEKAPKKRTYQTAPIDSMESVEEMIRYVGKGYLLKYGDLQRARAECHKASHLLWILRKASKSRTIGQDIYIVP